MCVYRNIEGRSRNHRRSRRAITVTYSDYFCSLSYPAFNAHAPYGHLWMYSSTRFLHIVSQTVRFSGTKVVEHKLCLDFLHDFCLKYLSF